MTPTLHIRRLDAELPAALAAGRLGPLRAALDSRLEAALRRAGVPPEWDVAIRLLEVEIDSDALEHDIADTIFAALAPLLQARPTSAEPNRIAVFPSRLAAGLEALRQVSRGQPPPWWWSALVGPARASLLTGPRAGDDIVSEWITLNPARAPSVVLALLNEGPAVLGLFSPAAGPRLLAALLAAHRTRSVELSDRQLSDRQLSDNHLLDSDELRSDLAEAPGASGSSSPAFEVVAPPRLEALLRLAAPEVALFFAAALVWEQAPGLADPLPAARQIVARCRSLLAPRSPAPKDDQQSISYQYSYINCFNHNIYHQDPPETPHPHSHPEAAPETSTLPAPPSPAQPFPSDMAAIDHPVGLGGLLFLLRWSARDLLLTDASDVGPILRAFADAVLERVLAPLSEPARAAVLRQHRVLLEVFSGTRSSAKAEPHDVEAALERLRLSLPQPLGALPSSLAWIYGPTPDLLASLPPEDHPLVALVVRPGRLRVEAHRADLFLSARLVDGELRRHGLDFDPGWIPWIGRTIRFHYVEDS